MNFNKNRLVQALLSSYLSGQMGSFPHSFGGEPWLLMLVGSGTCLTGQLMLCGLRT